MARADPEAFERILSDPAFAEVEVDPRLGAFGRAYYPAVYGDHDCSFVIYQKELRSCVCAHRLMASLASMACR